MWRAIAVGAVLLAFGLRAYRLDAQSLWADEGASAFMTGRGLGAIIQAAAGDIHPPLYYLALRLWSEGAGSGEYALRFLSLAESVLLVAVLFALGKRVLGSPTGAVAALLVATAPFHVYYSQEARMYAQVALLGTLSTYLLLRLLGVPGHGEPPLARLGRRPGRAWLLPAAYVAATAAALYTQYFAVSLLVVHNLAFLLLFPPLRRHLSRWIAWGFCQATVGLLCLPWVLKVAHVVLSWPGTKESLTLGELLRRVFRIYSFGPSWEAAATPSAESLFVGLLALGVVYPFLTPGVLYALQREPPNGRRRRIALVTLMLYVVVPVALVYFFSLRRPMFDAKLLLLATPPFYLLLAAGVVGAASFMARLPAHPWPGALSVRGLAAVAVGLLLLGVTQYATTRSLWAYYYQEGSARDDYRGIASYIRSHSRPDDAIILNAPGQSEIFGYYYQDPLAVYPLPRQRPLEPEPTGRELEKIVSQHSRVWVVLWAVAESDPGRFIQGWLGSNAFLTESRAFGNVELALYASERGAPARILSGQPEADFGGVATLTRYELTGDILRSSNEGAGGASPAGMLLLRLWWRASGIDPAPYSVFIHLIDQEGRRWAQQDGPLSVVTRATDPGEELSEQRGVLLPADIPAGDYYLALGVYHRREPGRPLPVTSAGSETARLTLGPVKVGSSQDTAMAAGELAASFASAPGQTPEVRLRGFSIAGGSGEPSVPTAAPGEALRLRLYWEAVQQPTDNYVVFTHLLGAGDFLFGQHDGEPAGGIRPTSAWRAGDSVADQHGIPIWLGTPPGTYRIEVGLYRRSGERLLILDETGSPLGDRILLGPVTITRPSSYPQPNTLYMQHTLDAALGDVRLLGYNLSLLGQDSPREAFAIGDTAHLTLFWSASGGRQPREAQPVVVELRTSGGATVWRQEQHPASGSYPTSLWEAGEVVRDSHRWELAVATGSYELWVGLGDRPPARLGAVQVR